MRYQFIKEYKGQFSVSSMCRVLKVSSSGYYSWLKRKESRRSQSNRALTLEIKRIHDESKQTYGRVYKELRAMGRRCSRKRVARLMRASDLKAKQKKRFKVTTNSKHSFPVAENHLNRQFKPKDKNQVWAADITYLWTEQGWLYLAVVLDLFSRRVIGWSMQPTMERGLVIAALEMALASRRPGNGLMHHSDRGSQYASGDYQRILSRADIICSMSRKGNCWDNAVVESFFATLKTELVYHKRYRTRDEAHMDVFEYIEVWYNQKRRHSSLDYLSPINYESKMTTQLLAKAA